MVVDTGVTLLVYGGLFGVIINRGNIGEGGWHLGVILFAFKGKCCSVLKPKNIRR